MSRLYPALETRQRWWKKINLWIVFVAVAVGVVGLAWGAENAHDTKVLAQELVIAGNRHHTETSKQNATITQLLQEHSTDFAQQQAAQNAAKAYDADVYAFAQTIEAELRAICVQTGAACPALPQLPSPPTP